MSSETLPSRDMCNWHFNKIIKSIKLKTFLYTQQSAGNLYFMRHQSEIWIYIVFDSCINIETCCINFMILLFILYNNVLLHRECKNIYNKVAHHIDEFYDDKCLQYVGVISLVVSPSSRNALLWGMTEWRYCFTWHSLCSVLVCALIQLVYMWQVFVIIKRLFKLDRRSHSRNTHTHTQSLWWWWWGKGNCHWLNYVWNILI